MKDYTIYILYLLFYLSIPGVPAHAIDLTGARPLGMGGAYVGVADDANALFWNPAGMKQFTNNVLETNFHIDEDNSHPRGNFIIINSKKKPLLDGGIGVSRHRSVINGTEYDKTDVIISLADQYTDSFLIGVSGKYLDEKNNSSNTSKKSFSLDAGAILLLGDTLKFGITGYNLNDPSLDSYKRKVQIGIEVKFFNMVNIAADGARLFSEDSGDKFNYNLGGEIELTKRFSIRGGYSEEKIYDNRYVSAGIGLLTSKAIVNYAYVYDLTSGVRERHLLGVTYVF